MVCGGSSLAEKEMKSAGFVVEVDDETAEHIGVAGGLRGESAVSSPRYASDIAEYQVAWPPVVQLLHSVRNTFNTSSP